MIKINTSTISNENIRYNSKFQFAFCTAPINKERYQITNFQTCRDYLHDMIKVHINKSTGYDNGCGYTYNKSKPIDMKRIRLLVTGTSRGDSFKRFKNGLYSGKRIINLYEKNSGLPSTRISEVKHLHKKRCWLLIGPSEWMNNPHLLSLFTFTLRIFTNIGNDVKLKTNENLLKFYNSILEKPPFISGDYNILKNTWDKGLSIMQNREALFRDVTLKMLFSNKTNWNSFHSEGGINSLCLGNSHNEIVNKRIRQLFQK